MHVLASAAMILGRILLAGLFAAGALQKLIDPHTVEALLSARGLPQMFVWPAIAFNALVATCLIGGVWIGPIAISAALYCMVTSVFHFLPDDPWQMSIFVKNWAIAGGLLVLFAHAVQHRD